MVVLLNLLTCLRSKLQKVMFLIINMKYNVKEIFRFLIFFKIVMMKIRKILMI